MNVRQPSNAGVIRYLEKTRKTNAPDVRPHRRRDYWHSGAHPEIAERLWEQLAHGLPDECRQVVLGTPALVHPASGVLIAIALGTAYALRLPSKALRVALSEDVEIETVWSDGSRLNVRDEFGAGWVLGSWSQNEEQWCAEVFEELAAQG